MLRSLGWLALAVSLVGCNSPRPTFDPFAPYGSRRIPPPATGSIGRPTGYYQSPAVPSGSNFQPVPSQAGFAPPTFIPQAQVAGGVAPAIPNFQPSPSPSTFVPPTFAPPRTFAAPLANGNWQPIRQQQPLPPSGNGSQLTSSSSPGRLSDSRRLEWIPPSFDPYSPVRQASAETPFREGSRDPNVRSADIRQIESRPISSPIRPYIVRGASESIGSSDCGCDADRASDNLGQVDHIEPIPR